MRACITEPKSTASTMPKDKGARERMAYAMGKTTANSHPTMKACSKSVNIGHANGTVAMARRSCPLL